MKTIEKTKMIVVVLLFFFLVNYPFIGGIDGVTVFGVFPFTYLYFYAIWFILILIMSVLIRKIKK